MKMKEKVDALIDIFDKAYGILKYALNNPDNQFIRHTAVERFDFTRDIFYKTISLYMETEGKDNNNIDNVLTEAKNLKIIDDINIFTEILNKNSHFKERILNGSTHETFIKLNDLSDTMKNAIDKLKTNNTVS